MGIGNSNYNQNLSWQTTNLVPDLRPFNYGHVAFGKGLGRGGIKFSKKKKKKE